MSLFNHYDSAIEQGYIQDSPLQRQVLSRLERIINDFERSKKSWRTWFKKGSFQGAYLYGPVGVGKTFLMDLFFDSIPLEKKLRFHFHYFMQQVDAQLRQLQGVRDPLQRIAADIAKKAKLLCFDEFMVEDVAYAMILAELMQALFARQVVLVATSNVAPDDLYRNGVQRCRFLPAIAAIKRHCEIIHIDYKKDYRLNRAIDLKTYLYPLGNETTALLNKQFNYLAPSAQTYGTLTIQKREIPYIKMSDRHIWFDFKVLCNLPRSQLDYLEIAQRFDTVFVSDIPLLEDHDTVFAILLIHFIDIMYDQKIRLVLSAAVPIDELYRQGEMEQVFKRTKSRLHEMQSNDYKQRHPYRVTPYLF